VKRFVPSDVCLACDGCCRYAEARTSWAPFFLFDEIERLTREDRVPSCLFAHVGAAAGCGARIQLTEENGHFFCPCLDAHRHACLIYPDRPFDCRLYPFLLARRDTGPCLAVDENCPYLRERIGSPAFTAHVDYLRQLFGGPRGAAFLRLHPDIIQDYPSDVRVLYPLSRP